MSSFHVTLADFPVTSGFPFASRIAGSNAIIVACDPSAASVAVSTNQGASWTTASISAAIGGAAEALAWNGTKFMVARRNKVSFSTDGITWSAGVTVGTVNASESIGSVACNATGWLIGYLSATVGGGYLAYTSDESTFSVNDPSGNKPEWTALFEASGTWYAFARDLNVSNVSRFYTSVNGTSWTQQSSNAFPPSNTPNYKQIRKVGSTLVLANASGSNPAFSTDGGATWTPATTPANRGFYLDTNLAGTRFVYHENAFSGSPVPRFWDGPASPNAWGVSTIDNGFTYNLIANLAEACYSFASDVRAFSASASGTGAFSNSKLGYLATSTPAFWTNLTNATETIGA